MIIYTSLWLRDLARELIPGVKLIDPVKEKDLFLEMLPKATAVVGSGFVVDEKFLNLAPKLKIVALTTVGHDNCNVELMTKRGVMLTNTPDVLTETTADLGFALMMSAARRIPEGQEMIKRGEWVAAIDERNFGLDVHGKKLGVIGLGRIGEAIARRGHFGFGMEILYHSRREKNVSFKARHVSLDDLLNESDFVMVVVPLSEETKRLIGERELRQMKKTAILINIARGDVVDETALAEALKEQRIYAAALDVFQREPLPATSPLLSLKNVVLTPHIGSATIATRESMARMAIQNMHQAIEGKMPKNLVNPEVISGQKR